MKEEPGSGFLDKWLLRREELLKQHPELTKDDFAFKKGEEEQLMDRLVAKMGKTKKEIREWLALMGG